MTCCSLRITMIERLIKEDYLQYIDWDLIPNKGSLMDEVMNKSYDPGNRYSCPYFWGTVGILYDTTVVDPEDLQEGWDLLRDTKYKGNIYMYDSERVLYDRTECSWIFHEYYR